MSRPDEYHRHLFNLATWLESERTVLQREQLPTLGEVVTEVMELAEAAGII